MKTRLEQMSFDFVVEMDYEEAERREQEKKESQQRNEDERWEHAKKEYPVTEAEKIWLPPGIRLACYIHENECKGCDMDTEDHTERWKYEQKVCLKDVHQIESELGRKIECCYQKLRRQPVTKEERAILAQFPDYCHLATVADLVSSTGIAESALRPLLGLMHVKCLVYQVGSDQFHRVTSAGEEVNNEMP